MNKWVVLHEGGSSASGFLNSGDHGGGEVHIPIDVGDDDRDKHPTSIAVYEP